MSAKRLSMRKIREVLRLKYELGFTHRTIAKALRVAVGTVSEYLAKAKKGGLSWPLPEELSDGELEAGLFPPPGQQFAPFQRPLESAIAVGYIFLFSEVRGSTRGPPSRTTRPGCLPWAVAGRSRCRSVSGSRSPGASRSHRRVDQHEAAGGSGSEPRNQRWIHFLRSTTIPA